MGATVFLLCVGLVMVYSASTVSDIVNLGDSAHHLKRQALWVAIGAAILWFVRSFDYRRLTGFVWPFYGASLIGLLLVLTPLGVGKWGAQRWIDLGFTTVQPSEYARLACLLVAVYLLVQLHKGRLAWKDFWGRLALASAAVVGLVMMQPDMGTTVSIMAAVFVVLLLGRTPWSIIFGMLAGAVAVGALAIAVAPYRMQRFTAFLDPWADPQKSGFQTIQAYLAFGSGGIDGVGLGMSRQKFFYLPAAHTDFIFAIIGEELGLIGTLAVVTAFAVFAYAGIRIALGAKDEFGRLLAGGLTAMILSQALMNMAAVTGLMPVTGIPMPLVSFGGSSMTFTMACVGLILSVSTYGSRGVRSVGGPRESKVTARESADERRRDGRPRLSGIDGGRAASRRRA
jgi:cell division protein FtsW